MYIAFDSLVAYRLMTMRWTWCVYVHAYISVLLNVIDALSLSLGILPLKIIWNTFQYSAIPIGTPIRDAINRTILWCYKIFQAYNALINQVCASFVKNWSITNRWLYLHNCVVAINLLSVVTNIEYERERGKKMVCNRFENWTHTHTHL